MNKNRNLFIAAALIFVCSLCASARAQSAPTPTPAPAPLPNTDVFIVDVSGGGDALKLGVPRRITDWSGYDNQPSFTPDGGALLYTSIRADDQADVYRYDFADSSVARLTDTPESEYSPTVTPDGKHFSVVRVEKDEAATQRLWKFPLKGGAPSLVLEKFKPVGYHAWADERTLALFILGQPVTLQVVDAKTNEHGVIATNVGRSLQRVPRTRKVTYVQKTSPEEWLIKEYDTATHAKRTHAKTLPGSEDYAWTQDGLILMAQGSKLYALRPGKETSWRELADFSSAGLRAITRIAVSPRNDRIAVVALHESAAK